MQKLVLILAAVFSLLAMPAFADEVRRENIRFPAGASSASVKGSVKGYNTVEYLLGASAGQVMKVSMTTTNGSNYFNVLPAGSQEAIFIGSTEGNSFAGTLPQSGDYVIQVYLMRNAARRNESARFTVKVSITGAGAAENAPSGDFADGLSGGPDFWEVRGVPAGDKLNMRSGPSSGTKVVSRFSNGSILRNKGCKMNGETRWCKVEKPDNPSVNGWVAGKYLREGAPPAE